MADNEARLLSKIITDADIIPALQAKITDDWFMGPANKALWSFLHKHYANYRDVASDVVVNSNYPNFKVEPVTDPMDYLIDQMREARTHRLMGSTLEKAVRAWESKDDQTAIIQIARDLSDIQAVNSAGTHELDLTNDPLDRYQEYLDIGNGHMLGIPTGFTGVDEATAGLQPGQLVTLVAAPKTGKSQAALKIAINCHEAGNRILFQSFEMNNHEQQRRHDAMRAKISHDRLRRGKLTAKEEVKYQDMLQQFSGKDSFHLVDAVNGMTVSALSAKIDQLKPNIVFVDGVYLMMDEVSGEMNTPQSLTNITRSLKRLAQTHNIPIVITTQTLLWKMKNGKVGADSIGYSSSFLQDSDVVLGLEAEEGLDDFRTLKIVASRNCGPNMSLLAWRWDTGCFHDEIEMSTCPECLNFGTP